MEGYFNIVIYLFILIGIVIFNGIKVYKKSKSQDNERHEADLSNENIHIYEDIDEQQYLNQQQQQFFERKVEDNTIQEKKIDTLKEITLNKSEKKSIKISDDNQQNKNIDLRKAVILSEILNRPYD